MHTEARLEAADGLKLLVQTWKPRGESKAALVIVHGLKDYADRYADFAAEAARRGYEVHASTSWAARSRCRCWRCTARWTR